MKLPMCLLVATIALAPSVPAAEEAGTTIVGERESPVGLNLMPWKNETRADLDLAPALLTGSPKVLPADEFREQMETYDAIASHRRARRNSYR